MTPFIKLFDFFFSPCSFNTRDAFLIEVLHQRAVKVSVLAKSRERGYREKARFHESCIHFMELIPDWFIS